MTGSEIDARIFVVGVPRSGTTLVQSLLAAHSRTTSFTESHFFSRHFALLLGTSVPVLTRDPSERLREFLAENGAERSEAAIAIEERFGRALAPRPLLPFRTRAVAVELLRCLDDLARQRGRSIWIEKTPAHLRYVPFLERLSKTGPRARFVHVIRGGLETVASLMTASRSWERSYDLETCVARWNREVAFSLARAGSGADCFVLYEQLTAEPEAILERLCANLGLAWEPEILERRGQGSEPLITPDETWKQGVDGDLRTSGTSERALSREQRERVRRLLRTDLYERALELETP